MVGLRKINSNLEDRSRRAVQSSVVGVKLFVSPIGGVVGMAGLPIEPGQEGRKSIKRAVLWTL